MGTIQAKEFKEFNSEQVRVREIIFELIRHSKTTMMNQYVNKKEGSPGVCDQDQETETLKQETTSQNLLNLIVHKSLGVFEAPTSKWMGALQAGFGSFGPA